QVHALVALDDEINRDVVQEVLSDRAVRVLDYVDLARLGADDSGAGDVLIVACAEYSSSVGECLAVATRHHPARPVVLLCPTASNGYVSEAFDAGADDIVALPQNGDIDAARATSRQMMFAVEKAVARRKGAVATGERQ